MQTYSLLLGESRASLLSETPPPHTVVHEAGVTNHVVAAMFVSVFIVLT